VLKQQCEKGGIMWRSALTAVLVPTLVWGQSIAERSQPATTSTPQPTYNFLTEWQTVRPGGSEKVVIRLFLGPFYVVAPHERSRDLAPLQIEFDESDVVNVTSLNFPADRLADVNDRRIRVLPSDPNVAVIDVTMNLKVAKNAALGTHLLRGRVKYQAAPDSGVLAPQQTEIQLPVIVLDRDVASMRNAEYATRVESKANSGYSAPKHELVWIILLAPIFIPLLIFSSIVCGIRGEDCNC